MVCAFVLPDGNNNEHTKHMKIKSKPRNTRYQIDVKDGAGNVIASFFGKHANENCMAFVLATNKP